MNFLSDQLSDGRKIRVLSIVDNFTRMSPALDVRTSYRGSDMVETLVEFVYRAPSLVKESYQTRTCSTFMGGRTHNECEYA